jgi:hypothetical protein
MITRSSMFATAVFLWLALPLGFATQALLAQLLLASLTEGSDKYGIALVIGVSLVAAFATYQLSNSNWPVWQRTRDRMCRFGTGVAQLTLIWYFLSLPFQLLYSVLRGA